MLAEAGVFYLPKELDRKNWPSEDKQVGMLTERVFAFAKGCADAEQAVLEYKDKTIMSPTFPSSFAPDQMKFRKKVYEKLDRLRTKADLRWVGFDRLVETLQELDVDPKVLISVAGELIKDSDGYVQNAGLTILGSWSSIVYPLETGMNISRQLIEDSREFIPTIDPEDGEIVAEKFSPRGATTYNFLRAVEGLLRMYKHACSRYDARPKQAEKIQQLVLNSLQERLSGTSRSILVEAISQPNMEGTMIQRIHQGGRNQPPETKQIYDVLFGQEEL